MHPLMRLFNLKGGVEYGESLTAWAADEIERLGSANRDLQDRLDDARATAEQAQARAAELESDLNFVVGIGSKTTEAATLRKQAEAVDVAVSQAQFSMSEHTWSQSGIPDAGFALKEVKASAKRLRQQADELEKHND